jgi:hypothetical protein
MAHVSLRRPKWSSRTIRHPKALHTVSAAVPTDLAPVPGDVVAMQLIWEWVYTGFVPVRLITLFGHSRD